MQNKKLLVCLKCHSFYSADQDKLGNVCPDCKCTLQYVPYSYERYSSLSDDQKDAFKASYIKDHLSSSNAPAVFEPLPQSSWVAFMGCCGWFTVIGLLIAGILCSVLGSFAIGIALMISAPISGGALILFSIVAEDVRHIRNQVDKLHYDRDHQ